MPASVPVPPRGQGGRRSIQVTRDQLEQLIKGGEGGRSGLVDAVRLVTAARAAAGPGLTDFRVYLVGGSSRIPMLGQLVQQETETSPISHGDPSTAVAEGAAESARSTYVDDGDERARPFPAASASVVAPARRPLSGPPRDLGRALFAAAVVAVTILALFPSDPVPTPPTRPP